jgi:hypothetical protein
LIIASLVFGGGWAATVLKVVEKGITEAAAKKLVITIGIGLLTTGGTKSKGNPMSFDVSGTEEEFSACPDCYTICGTTYETSAGQLPRCDKGLGTATVVIDYKNQTYSCREGYCGMWENKKVKIELLNPSGTKVATDYTTTDGSGQFSYTFAAPSGDGEFTAIVSVPKDW